MSSDVAAIEPPSPAGTGHALRWAAYLGASWTWIIGMVLPIFLLRDFGRAGFLIFAIPNVIGAAAMGWVVRSPTQSRSFVASHRVATQSFSWVTIAFHFYVLGWLAPKLAGPGFAAISIGGALLAAFPVALFTRRSLAPLVAIGVLAFSLLIAACMSGFGALGLPSVDVAPRALDLISLSIVCALGFFTCPYLDLTFHHARQQCDEPRDSRIAFGVGFGVCFFAMIVLTFLYAKNFYVPASAARVALAFVAVHIAVQAIFTVAIHAAALRGSSADARVLPIAVGVALAASLLAAALEAHGLTVGPLVAGEVGYRLFMSYYGLLAPAYLAIASHASDRPPTRRAITTTLIACAVAAPFFWIGFMHAAMRWAIPGVVVLLVAAALERMATPIAPRGSPPPPAGPRPSRR